MNKHVNEYQDWLEDAIEENLNAMREDLEYANKMYHMDEHIVVDELLQNIIKGASVTMALISPLMMITDEDTMTEFIEGGIDE